MPGTLPKGFFSFTTEDINRITDIAGVKKILMLLKDDLQMFNKLLNVESNQTQANFDGIPGFGWVWANLVSISTNWDNMAGAASDGSTVTKVTMPLPLVFLLSGFCDTVKVYGHCLDSGQTHFHLKIEVYYEDAWHTIEDGTTEISNNTWTEFEAGSKFITLVRVTDMTGLPATYLAEIMARILTNTSL